LKFLVFTIFLFLYTGIQSPNFHRLDFGSFTIDTPTDWIALKEHGTDSYVGALTNKRDTLNFDYGWYSWSVWNVDVDGKIKHKLAKDTVNGLIAYIVIPILEGHGEIGMSIEKFKDPQQKFSISGSNILGTDTILRIFKTIRFTESDTTLNPALTLEKFNKIPTGSGKMIFKTNCASCHVKNYNLIGPALKDIKSKRSLDWIYTFLTNKKALNLISKNKQKKKALQCEEFPTLTKDEIERILEYIN
jgi:hypothetical protein